MEKKVCTFTNIEMHELQEQVAVNLYICVLPT